MKNTLLVFGLILISFFSYAQIIDFPDANFKNALVNTKCIDTNSDGVGDKDVDENNDGKIDFNETLSVENLSLKNQNIISIKGIENFKNLILLDLQGNSILGLNLQNLSKLQNLNCSYNNLNVLDVTNNIELTILNCINNNITSLTLDHLSNLKKLYCSSNKIESLELNNLLKLEEIWCFSNELIFLNLNNLPQLGYLRCNSNNLKLIDVEKLDNLWGLECDNNELEILNIKTPNLSNITFFNNYDLKYICCMQKDLEWIRHITFNSQSYQAEINTYCSFTPGGKYGVIKGKAKFSIGGVCSENSFAFTKLKLRINKSNNEYEYLVTNSGFYFLPILEGINVIEPILENPDYFNVFPDSITVTFPSTSDTIIQDFCITPKGILKQVDLSIIPLTPPARPGFDASYKIVMTNKGNQVENGTLNFSYDETKMDFVSTDVNPTSQSDGLLSWNFTDLLPFETRYYNVTLNVNSPTETPPVNAGDELLITCNILDNVFLLKQEVVGSYDPNDKTCLEGKTITPEQVGQYVHYLIRFENTGNYAAENVVVKDVIDESTFDISTLQITDASHEAWARINGDVVEFIFENIQLPFDDASNDGYICFKIKTKQTLVLGNELKNEANIYFDYNLPILTNKTNTIIALPVGTDEAIGESDIEIFPNPVSDVLKFTGDDKILKVEIYDISGRLVQVSNVVDGEVNVERLLRGTYQMKVYTQIGVMNSKMVKN